MDDAWATIGEITSRLDASSALPPETEKLLRIMKLTEEAGEVTQAVIGVMGQNPRKGITHTWDDVHAELCDVIFTAMVALATLAPDAPEVFDAHLARVAARSLREPDSAPGHPLAPACGCRGGDSRRHEARVPKVVL
ncbi:MAG TPA: MazG-like family protein [Trebonia sp.]|jgi:NTP pyrophosphatase (non-canonical NTP hydrolase)